MNEQNEAEKLFSLKDLSDLDDGVKSELRITNSNDEQILNLFKIRDTLSIDQIIVGLSRKYHTNRKRSYVLNRIYSLSKKGFLSKLEGKKGIYRLST